MRNVRDSGMMGHHRFRPLAVRLTLVLTLILTTLTMTTLPANAAFMPWEPLGSSPVGEPASVSWGPGRIDVFTRDAGNRVYHQYYENGWESLGGTVTAAPAVTSWAPGRLDLFARGSAGELLHRYYAAPFNVWNGWESLGGGIVGAPAAAAWGPDHVDVVTRGAGDAMYHRSYAVSGWGPWWQVGGVLNGPPAVVSHWPGILDVVVTGGDNAVYHQTFFGGWWGWQRLGGVASSGLGRRIVYCNSCQRAWHVDENGDWYTFRVSGKVGVPAPGEYHVIRRLSPGGSGDLILSVLRRLRLRVNV